MRRENTRGVDAKTVKRAQDTLAKSAALVVVENDAHGLRLPQKEEARQKNSQGCEKLLPCLPSLVPIHKVATALLHFD